MTGIGVEQVSDGGHHGPEIRLGYLFCRRHAHQMTESPHEISRTMTAKHRWPTWPTARMPHRRQELIMDLLTSVVVDRHRIEVAPAVQPRSGDLDVLLPANLSGLAKVRFIGEASHEDLVKDLGCPLPGHPGHRDTHGLSQSRRWPVTVLGQPDERLRGRRPGRDQLLGFAHQSLGLHRIILPERANS
ncbi:MAG TPA: hypothetical protein VFC19_27025 [Candidatus Limnocylindrales bacterium]|nr:hypothetical protein [Candidatus Limnocylindrales bacterium]